MSSGANASRDARWAALLLAASAALTGGASGAAATGATATTAAAPPEAAALVRAADESLHPVGEGVVRIRATVEAPEAEPAVSDLEVYVQGGDRALCVFTGGTLQGRRILVSGEDTWLLVPGTKRPIPVSAGQRLLGGAAIADVARMRFSAGYDSTLREAEETVDDVPCRVVDLRAGSRRAPYATGVLWIGREDGLARQARFYLASGKLAKEVRFAAYRRMAGRMVLSRMTIAHLLPSEKGMTTTLDFTTYESRTLDPGYFDPVEARERP
jgi:hypothetical protein